MARLAAGAASVGLWAQGKETNPLAYALLWHNEKPKTSQRAPIQKAGVDAVLASGGNGAGKTELGAQVSVAVALGRDDPSVQAWIKANDVEPSLIPPTPGIVLASSLNSALSVNVQRAAIDKYLPAGTKWRNRDGPGLSEARTPNGGRILFVTNDAGARAIQGYKAHLLWMDEEHDMGIYNEGCQRLTRCQWEGRSGWALLTMTPLKGLTWVYDRFIQDPEEGTHTCWLHGADNPWIDQEKRARLLRQYGAHERSARDRGEFVTLEGRVYADFRRDIHVIDPIEPVPAHWPRYGSIDFGTRNPFCFLLFAVDPSDDVVHVIGEHYQAEWTLSQHAHKIHDMTNHGGPSLQWIVADPEDRGSRLSLAREHGISTVVAKKQIRAGVNAVCERLALDVEGRPHLVIHRGKAPNLVREIESYVWDTRSSKTLDPKDLPRKKNDHAVDALRYGCMALSSSAFAVG